MTELLLSEATTSLDTLAVELDGDLYRPGDDGWDEARTAWNLAVDQRPAAVVLAESAADVAATIRAANADGLRVAPQGTGIVNPSLVANLPWLRTCRCGRSSTDASARSSRS